MTTLLIILDETELLMTIIFLFNYCLIGYNRYKEMYGFITITTEHKKNMGHVFAMVISMLVLFIIDSFRLTITLSHVVYTLSYETKIAFILIEWVISLIFTILVITFTYNKRKLDSGKIPRAKMLKVTKVQMYRLQVAGFLSLLEIGITCARILIS